MNSGLQQKNTQDNNTEKGFVSIFTVLVIMAILTLVMVGFSNITRRAQRETLDDQLNTQAYYAAESGINEVQKYLVANPDFTKTECQGNAGGFTGYNNGLDGNLEVGYSCLLVNEAQEDFQISDVPLESSAGAKVFPFESSTDAPQYFDITMSKDSMTVPSNSGANLFVPNSSPSREGSDIGVLRVDLVPTTDFERLGMITGSYTFFVYFSTLGNLGTQTITNGTTGQGNTVFAYCASGPTCKTTIRLNSPAVPTYMMRISSIYSPFKLVINNLRDASSRKLKFQNGQKIIDVTGKANDVFRRVQVRIPNIIEGMSANFALQTADSICKRLQVQPADTNTDPLYTSEPSCRID